jgi:hypothetical protein
MMTAQLKITAERLRELLDYDPDTGWFRWRVSSQRVRVGQIAGNYARRGYWDIMVDGRSYRAHRLAWLYMTGKFPDRELDHIDGDGTNNRFSNLREATRSQNMANSRRRSDSKCDFKGVYQRDSSCFAHITTNGRQIHLGRFNTPEEAHAAYMAAARLHHGEFANDGGTRCQTKQQSPSASTNQLRIGPLMTEIKFSADSETSCETSAAPQIPDDVLWIIKQLRGHGVKVINSNGEDLRPADLEELVREGLL